MTGDRTRPIGEQTWTDAQGNTWNSYGNLILDDTLIQTTRQQLAEYLRGVYLGRVNVYDYPPDLVSAPALVISIGDPYAEPYDAGGLQVIWNFDVVLITQRGKVDESLARLEFMAMNLQQDLIGFPSARFVQFGEVGTTTIGEVEYLSGTMTVLVVNKIQAT